MLLGLISCQQSNIKKKPVARKSAEKPTEKPVVAKILTDKQLNSEVPFLFKGKDTIILNWTQWEHDKTKNILKFAFFNMKTEKFSTLDSVPVSKGLQMHPESMAKIGITDNNIMYAVYRKKDKNDRSRFGGKLYYATSKDFGKTWSAEKLVVNDPKATSLSFYDIAVLPNGEIGMSWLDNRRKLDPKHKGKCLFYGQTSQDKGFVIQKPVAGSTCECCRTEIFVDSNGNIHIAYRNIIEPDEPGFDGYGFTEIRDMYYLKSMDSGKTFTHPIPISKDNWHVNGCPHTGPSLAFNGEKLGAVWFTGAPSNSGIFFTDKKPEQKNFNPKNLISREGRHPQMVSLNGNFHIVYEEYYEQNGKGYYKITLKTIKANGEETTTEISPKLTHNNHPVITSFGKNKLLIVWVNSDTRHPKLMYSIYAIK